LAKALQFALDENAQVIKTAGFDYVWFPPPSRSAAGDNSYLPTEWYALENGYGNQDELKQAVAALKPTTIALMHGPTFKGDGAAALNGLADHYKALSS